MGGKGVLWYKNRLLFCFILSFFSLLLVNPGPVFSQDGAEEFTLEEIVVTGSRIARNNNEATSPIVTVDETLFDQSSTSAIETQLNKLPQFTPTADIPQIAGGDIQPTATNTPGEATVALRGLGANRTLVLINGRRGTPSNALGVLDINTIPTSAIQYVEAISGGASSTYGADAMAGVLNFIMKDRFEGFELDAVGSITQEGDGGEYTVSGIMGTNFADDRGNIMMAFAYNERNEVMASDRKWYRKMWRDSSIYGTAFFPPYTGIDIGYGITGIYGNFPDVDVMNSVLEGATFDTSMNANGLYEQRSGTVIFYDPDSGRAFTGFSESAIPGVSSAEALGLVDGYNVKMLNAGYLGMNDTDAYLSFPLERYNFYTQGNYEINDYFGVFGQAYFSKTHARTTQIPGTITYGWSVLIDPTLNSDVIPSDILTILNSRMRPAQEGDPEYDPDAIFQTMVSGADDEFRLQADLPFRRVGLTDTFTFNMTAGLEGEIPGIDWTWEVFVSHGEAENTSNMTGFLSLERLRTIMQSENFGEGLTLTGNEGYPDYNFGAATATCTSGINPFDWESVTQDCWDAVSADVRTKQLMQQTIWEANAQGHIADLPTGEMRGALGASYRENNYYFLSDNLNTQGTSFNDQILGLYPAGESEGTIEAKEAYAELLVPVLKDLPFVDQLELNIGGRSSDYNTTGNSYTYKAELNWKTNDFLRFRGGYNRAERAPNIAELYLARTSSFGYMYYGDACSMNNGILSYSADPTVNDEWYEVVALCGQLMEAGEDTSEADSEYYGSDWRNIYDYAVANNGESNVDEASVEDQPSGGFSYIWPIDYGNEDLEPETADTWTFGFVLDSFVDDIPWLMDWRVSVDYYHVEINDAIGLQTGDVVQQMCLDPTFNSDYDYLSEYCSGVNRAIDDGTLDTIERTYYNNGRFKTSGIDLQINWGMEAGPGRVSVSTLLNYLISLKSTELDGVNPLVEYVGTYGPTGNGLDGYSMEWQMLTTVTYAWSKYDISVRWQHLDGLHDVSAASTNTPLPSYDIFDLLGNYRMNDNVTFRFGIENVLNIEPDLYGIDYTNADRMYGGSYSSRLQDLVGRRFYVGAKVYF